MKRFDVFDWLVCCLASLRLEKLEAAYTDRGVARFRDGMQALKPFLGAELCRTMRRGFLARLVSSLMPERKMCGENVQAYGKLLGAMLCLDKAERNETPLTALSAGEVAGLLEVVDAQLDSRLAQFNGLAEDVCQHPQLLGPFKAQALAGTKLWILIRADKQAGPVFRTRLTVQLEQVVERLLAPGGPTAKAACEAAYATAERDLEAIAAAMREVPGVTQVVDAFDQL